MIKALTNASVLETYSQNVHVLVLKIVRKENVLLKTDRTFAYAMMAQEIILGVKDHVLTIAIECT